MATKQKKNTKKQKSPEFTKYIVISLIILYYSFYLISLFIWTAQDRTVPDLLNWLSRPFAVIISSYFIKSAIENTNRIKKNYSEDKKKKMSFSTIVTILIVSSFFVSVLYFFGAWLILDRFPNELMEYIATPFVTALPTYIAKSIAETKATDNSIFAKVVDTINDIATSGVTSSNIGEIAKDFLIKNKEEESDDN